MTLLCKVMKCSIWLLVHIVWKWLWPECDIIVCLSYFLAFCVSGNLFAGKCTMRPSAGVRKPSERVRDKGDTEEVRIDWEVRSLC